MDSLDVPILETDRLRLRSFRNSDIDDYAALNAHSEVMRYMGGPWDRGRSWRHMAFLIGHWRLLGYGTWAVTEKETGAFLGRIGFSEPEGWPGCELAWALARRWWGCGYATEGARAALAYGFTVLNKDRVISLIQQENRASLRVAERLGERLQGRADLNGREMLCFGIGRADPLAPGLAAERREKIEELGIELGAPALAHDVQGFAGGGLRLAGLAGG